MNADAIGAATRDAVLSSPLGMSLEQARKTRWPFRPFKGQLMGTLSDKMQLPLKELVYAIENAWDDRVRQAATVLLLVRLDQEMKEPPPLAGRLRVVASGRTFSRRRQLALSFLEGGFLGAGFAASVWLFVASLTRESSAHPTIPLSTVLASPTGIAVLIMMALLSAGIIWLAFFLIDRVTKRLDKEIENYQQGQDGEDMVVEQARQALDGKWTLFRNVVLPGRKAPDLDIVLVGEPGVWLLEVKTLKGEYRNLGETWEYRAGRKWKSAAQNPSRQATNSAVALRDLLRGEGIKTFVPAAIVWANQETNPLVEDPRVAVWTMDRLQEKLGDLWHGEQMDEATRGRVVEKLTQLCQRYHKAA